MPRWTLDEARARAHAALAASGAAPEMARETAKALVAAEAIGQGGHGLSRVPQYAGFLRHGRAVGDAEPRLVAERGGAALLDAGDGLAYPALKLAEAEATARAERFGVASVAIRRSHHAGALGLPVERLARHGLVALAVTNSPAAIAAPGGRRALFGTNPVAAAFPRRDGEPLVADLALSAVARGRIAQAAAKGEAIPAGWALDAEGRATTDPRAAMGGTMLALGGAKGAVLALLVEAWIASLAGSALGFEADSFFEEQGNRPGLGLVLLAFDPGALCGREASLSRMDALCDALLGDGARLPGARRAALRARAEADGIEVADALATRLLALAG
jgi:(2R)-3-sulfolactate dehydrogenase (NADP+)